MSYVHSNLLQGEELYLFTYGHWIALAKPIAASIVLLGGWYCAPMLLDLLRESAAQSAAVQQYVPLDVQRIPHYDLLSAGSLKVLAVLVATCILWFVGAWLKYVASEFAITGQRVMVKHGLILRRTNELFLGSVESVHLHQSIAGRLLGYGTLTVIGRGNTRYNLVDVSHPDRFRQTLQEQSARMRQRAS